ncbi:Carbohydrate-binding domain family 9-like protein [Akanthomyces lecanii RCEF 1005]|uniref:Carbohydrate-binding domain family 9-like protein n=1 Tax=Akanthomyces lecanii RCEF 1005 TaxID=1081108 RepID=A0A162KP56_CORDF|nr:Carbohydrate-binding domain family 9-like protein [Akanthomyces lecanii RCEF 1005]
MSTRSSTRLHHLFTAILASSSVQATPAQYCRFGHGAGEVDFCLGVSTHRNSSTNYHDVYLSLSVTRDSDTGWTAVGAGSSMVGALMFIVYGDPDGDASPVLSVRTVESHQQPRLVSKADMGGADLRVLQARWMQTTPSAQYEQYALSASHRPQSARFSIVCYSCERWPGTPFTPDAASQPWIWAWNSQQQFEVYSFDADLDMHAHGAGQGGWGCFYMNMARALTQPGDYLPSFPPLRPAVLHVGASDTPIGFKGVTAVVDRFWRKILTTSPHQRAHGVLMASSILVLFPAGILALRSGSPHAFMYHWLLQSLATMCMLFGVGLGVLLVRTHGHNAADHHIIKSKLASSLSGNYGHRKRHDESSAAAAAMFAAHQWLGGIFVSFVMLQILLGWWHHVIFVRIRARTWVSHVHIWLGRTSMLEGSMNLLLGMALASYSMASISVAAVFIILETLAIAFWIRRKRAMLHSAAGDYRD